MRTPSFPRVLACVCALAIMSCADLPQRPTYDVVIRGGTIYDGTGSPAIVGDLAIDDDRIAAIGDVGAVRGAVEIDAAGLAVAPGFINMLSWADESLIADGRGQSDIRQGVTLEVFGEGGSMGPLNDAMKKEMVEHQGDIKYAIEWTTLGEYLEYLERRGVSPNVASFVGATTVRIHELGRVDRAPTPAELERMQALVRQAMEDGALGVGSSLIYAPAFYAKTDELIALCRPPRRTAACTSRTCAAKATGCSRRSTSSSTIARASKAPAEIYHLKAAGKANWPKLTAALSSDRGGARRRASASPRTCTPTRPAPPDSTPPCRRGCRRAATTPGSRGSRIRRSARRVAAEMKTPTDEWENFFTAVGGPEQDPARRLQERRAQAADRQDAGRGRAHARQVAGRNRHGPGHRGRQPRRHGLLPDVGGERQAADGAAVGELRLRRRGAGARRACSSSRIRIRAPTAASRACSATTSRDEKADRWRRRSAG